MVPNIIHYPGTERADICVHCSRCIPIPPKTESPSRFEPHQLSFSAQNVMMMARWRAIRPSKILT
ncbi:hypothetical protein K504DRAFT_490112, partial [Pleomassaria siparia CBS 279.74]